MNAQSTPREISHSTAENLPPVVLIAASADGINAISSVTGALPPDFPAAVVVVQHRSADIESLLTRILAKRTQLMVNDAVAGQRLDPGNMYIANPSRHLTFNDDGTFRYVDGTRIRYVLSSADPLFQSAARIYGPKTVGIVLTGSGMDASDGVRAIKACGGTVIVQDPATAGHSGMPAAAIRTGAVDFVLPLQEIAPKLVALVTRDRESGR
jgi:two-component system chemotaxis response regulator CheB